MADVFDLQAKISLNTTEYKKSLSDAEKDTSNFGSKLKNGLENIAKVGAAAFGAIAAGATAATAALVKGVSSVATYGDNIDKMSQKLGMSAEAYQEWDAVMQHSGTSIDSMQASMKTLASAVETGNDAFERLGLSQEAIANMSQEQLFSATITALQNIDNETERTYLAGQLLGRGATELGALLNTSAEDTEKMKQRVHELGGVMSDEAVKAAAKYKDSLQDMKTAIGGMLKGVTGEFMPAFTDVMDGVAGIFSGDKGSAELISKGIDSILENISSATGRLKPVFANIGTVALDALKTAAPKLIKGGTQLMGNVIKGTIKNLPEILSFGFDALKGMGEGLADLFPEWVINDIGKIFSIVKDTFKSIDFGRILESFKNLGTSIGNIAEKIGSGFVWVSENILSPLITWASNDILPTFIDGLAAAFDILGSAVDFLEEPAKAVWDNFLKPLSEIAGDVIYGSLSLIAKGLKGIAAELEDVDWSGFWEDIDNGEFFADWERGWKSIKEWFSENSSDIDEFFNASEFGENWNKFWQNLGGVAYTAQEITKNCYEAAEVYVKKFVEVWVAGKNTIVDAVNAIMQKIKDFLELWNSGKETIIEAKNTLTEKIDKSTAKKGVKTASDVLKGLLPGYAEGGRVTRPTIALVGEKEPETIIPDSKRGELGNSYYNITVQVDGYSIKNDMEFTELLSEKLAQLGIIQQRAVGGKSWA